ncbi:hypothetical protein [Jiulongibacter sediminis]|jgi:hypothetical protein|uniref:hypothetical protein n=1 Tax=Jiulongibacter sediminis TaxID=1605367 RepID=UPI0026F32D2A|nr:hypothetical protein [Jiulongibacter sediminis]
MNPFLLISQFFKKERQELEEPYFELPEEEQADLSPVILSQKEVENSENASISKFESVPVKSDLPNWLQDEDLLRDEGVIFGLTDADANDKIKLIEAVFDEKAAEHKKLAELHSEKIGEHNLKMSQLEERVAEHQQKKETFALASLESHQLPRTSVSLILSIIMACGNFFLIDTVMKEAYPDVHFLVSIGVFFAGMYSFFTGKSFLQHSDEEVNWRKVLSETLLPLSASVFVFLQALGSMSTGLSVGLFLFVFSLFLYSGKLFLENISLFKEDLDVWKSNLEVKRNQKKGIDGIEEKLNELSIQLDEIRMEKWKIIPDLNKAEGKLEELKNQKQALIHLFESEFKLARSYRDKLTRAEIKKIIE